MKRSIKSLLATLVVSLSLAAPVLAGPYEDGKAAFKRGDFTTAEALFRKAAERGNAAAQHNLGAMYHWGEVVPQDYAKARGWYRKAIEQGFAESQLRLGVMYARGQGVPQDVAKAVEWFHKAAEQGFAEAQEELGWFYAKGLGVPQDYVMAHKWFNLAAAKRNVVASLAREGRDAVAKKMTPAQIAEAHRLAREWKPKNRVMKTIALSFLALALLAKTGHMATT